MATQTIPIETRETRADRLMRHAYRELANGDRLQASEKARGAVDCALEMVAERRGWKCETRADAFNIIRRLADELGDRVYLLFMTADNLHRNYLIDAMPLEELRTDLAYVEELLETLNGVGEERG